MIKTIDSHPIFFLIPIKSMTMNNVTPLIFALKTVAFNACQVILNTNSTSLPGESQTNAQHEHKEALPRRTEYFTPHCRLPLEQDSADMPSLLFIHLSYKPVSIAMTSEDHRSLRDLSASLICSLIHSFQSNLY